MINENEDAAHGDSNAHPLTLKKYTLPTPMVASAIKTLVRWISHGATGGMWHGIQRNGKTKTRKYAKRYLEKKFLGIVVFSFVCRTALVPSEKAFFERLLYFSGNEFPDKGNAREMRNRLTAYLASLAERSGQRRIVLFADEAQKLHEVHYGWLIDLHNELNELEVDLIVILIGQDELSEIRADYRVRRKNHIYGRFMSEVLHLVGISSAAEVQACLSCYDNAKKMRWPEKTGPSFSEYFFPEAYTSGWRLKDQAGKIWSAFEEVGKEKLILPEKLEIPTQYFCHALEAIMMTLGARKEKDPRFSPEELKKIIRRTGFGDGSNDGEDEEEQE